MRACDVMTRDVVTVAPETALAAAVRLMLDHRISGLPVIDATGDLVGMLTEGDLLRRAETGTDARHRSKLLGFLCGPGADPTDYVATHGRAVSEVMSSPVITAERDTPLQAVVDLMEAKKVRRVPVSDGGKLIGIVSRADLLRLLASRLAGTAKSASDDVTIEEAIRAELHRAQWMATDTVRIAAIDGKVTLSGTIFDERMRTALRVAAENTAGVTKVDDKLVTMDPTSGVFFAVA